MRSNLNNCLIVFNIWSFESFVHLFSIFSLRRSLMIQQMLHDLQTPVWLSGHADLNCNTECAFWMNTLTFCSSLWTDYWQMPGITFRSWWPALAQSNITAAQDPQALAASVIQIFKHSVSSMSPIWHLLRRHMYRLLIIAEGGCGQGVAPLLQTHASLRRGGGKTKNLIDFLRHVYAFNWNWAPYLLQIPHGALSFIQPLSCLTELHQLFSGSTLSGFNTYSIVIISLTPLWEQHGLGIRTNMLALLHKLAMTQYIFNETDSMSKYI